MIDFSSMNVGDKVNLPKGEWNDSLRTIYNDATNFAAQQDPIWQFSFERVVIGNKSTNPPTYDQYIIERIK